MISTPSRDHDWDAREVRNRDASRIWEPVGHLGVELCDVECCRSMSIMMSVVRPPRQRRWCRAWTQAPSSDPRPKLGSNSQAQAQAPTRVPSSHPSAKLVSRCRTRNPVPSPNAKLSPQFPAQVPVRDAEKITIRTKQILPPLTRK